MSVNEMPENGNNNQPQSEISEIDWESLQRVGTDPRAVKALEARMIDPCAVESSRMAYNVPVLTSTGPTLLDFIVIPVWRPGEARPVSYKTRKPDATNSHRTIGQVRGCIMASHYGQSLLRGWMPESGDVIICEGDSDLWSLESVLQDEMIPILSTGSGLWSDKIAAIIPPQATVWILTDQDPPGERYANKIALTLPGRTLMRLQDEAKTLNRRERRDISDRLRNGSLTLETWQDGCRRYFPVVPKVSSQRSIDNLNEVSEEAGSAYFDTALRNSCAEISGLQPTDRTNRFNAMAFSLGRLLALPGAPSISQVEVELMQAGKNAGITDRTMRECLGLSGSRPGALRDGLEKKPVHQLPESTHQPKKKKKKPRSIVKPKPALSAVEAEGVERIDSDDEDDEHAWIEVVRLDPRVIHNKFGRPNARHLPTMMACLEAYFNRNGGSGCQYDWSFGAVFIDGEKFSEEVSLVQLIAELSLAFSWTGDLYKPMLRAIFALGLSNSINSLTDAMPKAKQAWIDDGKRDLFDGFCARIFGGHHKKIDDIFMKKWFVGAVSRALYPGCEMALCPLLRSVEGTGKTRFARTVGEFAAVKGIRRMITLPPGAPLGSDAAVYHFLSSWIVELGELSALTRARQEDVKQVISEQVDSIIKKYLVTQSQCERRCVTIGTTNVHRPLKDPTGSRRFHVIEIIEVDVDTLRAELELIIGQAVHLLDEGETTWLSKEEVELQKLAAKDYQDEDSLSLSVLDYLKRHDGDCTTRQYERELHEEKDNGITASELRKFHIRIHEFLFSEGWSNRKDKKHGRKWRKDTTPKGQVDEPWNNQF